MSALAWGLIIFFIIIIVGAMVYLLSGSEGSVKDSDIYGSMLSKQ
jgi:hypothetical protein